jgi:hypothetical protein
MESHVRNLRFRAARPWLVAAGVALMTMAWAGPGRADLVFSGSSGNLAASADFALSGSTLTVTLTNTSTHDVLVPTDVLTGLGFHTTHTLTPVSASLNGSSVFYGSLAAAGVGAGWQYKSGLSFHGFNSGISTVGFGIFGPDGNFASPAVKVDGLDYGILSAGDNTATGNTGVTGHGPLIKNSVQFTLTAASGFSLSELGNSVVFQYGTALSDTHFNPPPVPEPSTMAIAGLGALGFVAYRLRRRYSK